MNILHICGSYIGNTLYKELFQELNKKNIYQFIYVPVKSQDKIGANNIEVLNGHLVYRDILKKYHRVLYFRKINTIYEDLSRVIKSEIYEYDCIHAHTLFSDGGVAYRLYKQYKIPYIVSIRNTDINIFFKYFYHLRFFIYNVLLHSSKIVFLSYAYINKLEKLLPKYIFEKIEEKFIVIPNAINKNFFLKPCSYSAKEDIGVIKLVTIASLDSNKNIVTILRVLKKIIEKGLDIKLDIIGDGVLKEKLTKFVEKNGIKKNVKFHGYLDNNTIIDILDSSHIFILTSIKETFGISYIEAMARGLPIIYTKNEGVDGYFRDGEVGYAVNPLDINEIVSFIDLIIKDYDSFSRRAYENSKAFKWERVAAEFEKIYLNSSEKIIQSS